MKRDFSNFSIQKQYSAQAKKLQNIRKRTHRSHQTRKHIKQNCSILYFQNKQYEQYGSHYQNAFLFASIIFKLQSQHGNINYVKPLKEQIIDLIESYEFLSKQPKFQAYKIFMKGIHLNSKIYNEKRILNLTKKSKDVIFHPTRIMCSQIFQKNLTQHPSSHLILFGMYGISKTFSCILLVKLLQYVVNYQILKRIKIVQFQKGVFQLPNNIEKILDLPRLFYLTIDPKDTMQNIKNKIRLQFSSQQSKYMEEKQAFSIKKIGIEYDKLGIRVHFIIDKINIYYSKVRKVNYKYADFFDDRGRLNTFGKKISNIYYKRIYQQKNIIRKGQYNNEGILKWQEFYDDDEESQSSTQQTIFEIIKFQEILFTLSEITTSIDGLSSINIQQYLKSQIKFSVQGNKFDQEITFQQIKYCEYLQHPACQQEILDFMTFSIIDEKIINPKFYQNTNQSSSTNQNHTVIQLQNHSVLQLQKQCSQNDIKKLFTQQRLYQILKKEKFSRINKEITKQKIKQNLKKYITTKKLSQQPSEIIPIQSRQHQLKQHQQYSLNSHSQLQLNQQKNLFKSLTRDFHILRAQLKKCIKQNYDSNYLLTPLILAQYFCHYRSSKYLLKNQTFSQIIEQLLSDIQLKTSQKFISIIHAFSTSTQGQIRDISVIRKLIIFNIKQFFKTLSYEDIKNNQNLQINIQNDFIIKLSDQSKNIIQILIQKNCFSFDKHKQNILINIPPKFLFYHIQQKSFEEKIDQSIASEQASILMKHTYNRELLMQFLLINAIKKSRKVEFNIQEFKMSQQISFFISLPKFDSNKKQFITSYPFIENMIHQIIKLKNNKQKNLPQDSILLEPVFKTKKNLLIKDSNSKSIDFAIIKIISQQNGEKIILNFYDVTTSSHQQHLNEKFRNFFDNFNQVKDKQKKQFQINSINYKIEYNFYLIIPKPSSNISVRKFINKEYNYKLKPLKNVTSQLYQVEYLTLKNIGFLYFEEIVFKNEKNEEITTVFKHMNQRIYQQKKKLREKSQIIIIDLTT